MSKNGIHIRFVGGGNVEFNFSHPNIENVRRMLEITQKELPVFQFNRQTKKYNTSIYHIPFFIKVAEKNGWDVFASSKFSRILKRMKLRLGQREETKYIDEFHSKYWTNDKSRKMLDYQACAVNFALFGHGALCGDDLGLGKTIVGIGVICKLFESGGGTKALVIVKNSLKRQWYNEILAFTKFSKWDIAIAGTREFYRCPLKLIEDGKVNFMSGICKECKNGDSCRDTVKDANKTRIHQINSGKIVITSYEVLRINASEFSKQKHRFCTIILDEASSIKTKTALVSKAILQLAQSHPMALPLPMSGTFIENALCDLWVPCAIVDKGILGDYSKFMAFYTIQDYFGTVIGYKNLEYVKKLLEPFLIRRTLDQVWKDRPGITEVNRICVMSEYQRKIYHDAYEGVLKDLRDREKEKKINFAGILALIQYLLSIACTVEVLEEGHSEKASTKISTLVDILENEIASDKKILIFCSYPYKVTPFIVKAIEKIGRKVLTVCGKVKKKVPEIIAKFKTSKIHNILIASDMLAFGHNIQEASYVVNVNLPWNPAILDQRIGRAYRRGQKHPVVVINLIAENTIDDRVLEKIGTKRQLFDSVLGYGDIQRNKKPSIDQLLDILKP